MTDIRRAPAGRQGFTLVELLVAMVVLIVILLIMVGMADQTSRIWRNSRSRIESFQAARDGFERITTILSQATLNTYLDYYSGANATGQSRSDVLAANPNAMFVPVSYGRAANLHLISGPAATLLPGSGTTRPTHAIFFQAPLGYVTAPTASTNDFTTLNLLLNAVGYYVEFSDDSVLRPNFITTATPSYRYRLMELSQPTQNLSIYFLPSTSSTAAAYYGAGSWYAQAVVPAASADASATTGTVPPVVVVADDVIALVVRPMLSDQVGSNAAPQDIAPNYSYDTKAYIDNNPAGGALQAMWQNQLPPLVQVTMVTLDATSAGRLATQYGSTAPPLLTNANSAFTDTTQYASDLQNLETYLTSLHLNYRVFVEQVSLRGAKWSN